MQQYAEEQRLAGKTISFVPTMGFLHKGHLSLLDIGRSHGSLLVLSIFVNPAQFGPNEDLDTYPRALEKDFELAKQRGVNVVFVPDSEQIYPKGYETHVELSTLPNHLCGLSRPVFFRGITTVVCQLFHIVKPHVAVFGEKDFQQLAIIRRMVNDLKMDVEIVGGPIIREPDGLAMSSRNSYLLPGIRPAALSLFKALTLAQKMVDEGERDAKRIKEGAEEIFAQFENIKIDYISLCCPQSLEEIQQIQKTTLMALAVNLDKTRLIDNRLLVP